MRPACYLDQRRTARGASTHELGSTIYHGLPRNLLHFNPGPGSYLAFLGRISPAKRPDLAIEVARRAGVSLKIAAKVDKLDYEYFANVVRSLLSTPGVEFIGEIDDSQKEKFLGGALALLFAVDWPEPFGLVMIESLACGTPVIARPCGSVPEVLRDGVTGLLASGISELVDAVRQVRTLSRRGCREEFEARFTAEVMATNYERIYYQLIAGRRRGARPQSGGRMGERRRTVRSQKHQARRAAERLVSDLPKRETRTTLKVGSDFYILASSLASRRATRVLASGESFAVLETGGDILESPLEALGFFSSDTRYLSRFELRIAGETPYFLNSYLSDDNAQLRVNLTNPDLGVQGGAIRLRRDEIQIERSWLLADSAIFHRLRVRNYARAPLQLPLEFAFAVDFADLFEVRGVKRKRRGNFFAPKVRPNSVTFSYQGLDQARRIAEVVFQQKPHKLSSNRGSFQLGLKPDAEVEFEIRVSGQSEGDRVARPSHPRPRLHSFDQGNVSKGLREVAEQLSRYWVVFFGVQSNVITKQASRSKSCCAS